MHQQIFLKHAHHPFNISNDILSIIALVFLDREEEIEKVEEKSKFVTWFNDAREEYFGLIAKKMDEEVKAALRTDGYLVFDMAELKKQNTNLFASK